MIGLFKKALTKKFEDSTFAYDENDTVWMPELLKFIDIQKIPQELYVRSQQQVEKPASKLTLPFSPSSPLVLVPPQVKQQKER